VYLRQRKKSNPIVAFRRRRFFSPLALSLAVWWQRAVRAQEKRKNLVSRMIS